MRSPGLMYLLDEFDSYQFQIDTANGARLIGEMVRRERQSSMHLYCTVDNGNEGGANGNLDGGNSGSTNYSALYDVQNRLVIPPQPGAAPFLMASSPTITNSTTALPIIFARARRAYSCPRKCYTAFTMAASARVSRKFGALFVRPPTAAACSSGRSSMKVSRMPPSAEWMSKGQSAPDGVVGPFRQKEAGYYACKSIFSPVQIAAPDPAEFSGTLAIFNNFDFTDLNQCVFQWQLGWFFRILLTRQIISSTNALTGGLLGGAASGDFPARQLPPAQTGY